MVKIIIENLAQKEVYTSDEPPVLLNVFQSEYIDWMHACGGKGRCTTCRFQILEGTENLSAHTHAELGYLKLNRLLKNERLACQVRALGNCRIRVPDDCKMPHLDYSD